MDLLTRVIADMVNKKAAEENYGVSISNLPPFNYVHFVTSLQIRANIEVFFLGFSDREVTMFTETLPEIENISYRFTVEDAETSRNSGKEDVFRVLIIKRSDIEKISSLRWFPDINLGTIYTQACKTVKQELASDTNAVISAIISAFDRKPVQNVLSFERVIEYLQLLVNINDSRELPKTVKNEYYRLGLFSDSKLDQGACSTKDIVDKILKNHSLVKRIENLEQAERQSITNYYSDSESDEKLPGLILKFYKTKDISLLKDMELSAVESCLKAVKKSGSGTTATRSSVTNTSATAIGAKLVFDGEEDIIDDVIAQISDEVDKVNEKKPSKVPVNTTNAGQIQIPVDPVTIAIAEQLSDDENYGGIIYAEVGTPGDAIADIAKYEHRDFDSEYTKDIFDFFEKYRANSAEPETISTALSEMLAARKNIVPFRKRLQDIPMLQVLSKKELFTRYLSAYEKLLNAINEDLPKIWRATPAKAKLVANTILSLDNVYVVGTENIHSMPTPLNPLYLWKYIRLGEEILCSRGVDELDAVHLSEEDKAFILRKSDDIPDPLSVTLVPESITHGSISLLPLTGRIGCMPVYSSNSQINQSENGKDELTQSIIRYLCLYPHAGMMLKISVIDPPSVEFVVSTLKSLNASREFNISGIEVSVFRTKQASSDWIEISDNSLNEGMLGSAKGKSLGDFKLHIREEVMSYDDVLDEIKHEQHIVVVFDPNEVKIERTPNNNQIHIHPLCVPKVYEYDPYEDSVSIRPSNEGDIFSTYASIIEKLHEQPSYYFHQSAFFRTPLSKGTYHNLLSKGDWIIILDQSLKSWDMSFQTESEKLYYKESEYRSIGIYSENSKKFVLGYDKLVKAIGNFIPDENGLLDVISSVRSLNNDGLLSIVSHSSNKIFDDNHGKGSLGLAIAAIYYKIHHPSSILVGLDTQLARTWLSSRDDDELPDMIGINLEPNGNAKVDLIEVKTYSNSPNSFIIQDQKISGHAVEQVSVLEELVREMFGKTEKITTISRREVLREQVYESLYQSSYDNSKKREFSEAFNSLFAGDCTVNILKNIYYVNFDEEYNGEIEYEGVDAFEGQRYFVTTIGKVLIQQILTHSEEAQYINVSRLDPPSIPEVPYTQDEEPSQPVSSGDNNILTSEEDEGEIPHNSPSTSSIPIENTVQPENIVQSTDYSRLLIDRCATFNQTLRTLDIQAKDVKPEMTLETSRFTRFKVELKPGEKIRNLERNSADIALRMQAMGQIMISPILGTSLIAVDIPFEGGKMVKLLDHLDILDGDKKGFLNVIAGQKADGEFSILDIADAPHLLVSGTTGSGKTVFLYSILVSLLKQFTPDELQLLIVDPKMTDFTYFDEIPQYLYGGHVIVETDEALEALNKINEEDKVERTNILRAARCRDIVEYNAKHPDNKMKRLVVIIDEYADLIQTAEMLGTRRDFERMLVFLAQRVRSLGIHLVVATQRPSANIVTGVLKSNIPYRISFKLPSSTDSMTILDASGAQDLLGKGDMLVAKNSSDIERMQGLFISGDELSVFLSRID